MEIQVTPLQNPDAAPLSKRSFLAANWGKILGFAVIGLIVFGSVFYFLNKKPFSESRVDFKIESPGEISSGELVNYKITYKNGNRVDLNNVKLVFFYPPDALPVRDGNIVATANENIEIGNLAAGQDGENTITAYLVGDKGNIKTAKATLIFVPANVRSTFKKQAGVSSTITKLAVPLTLVAPPTAVSGQSISYIIDYRNQSDQDFENIKLKLKYPDDFRFVSASPTPNEGSTVWKIDKLLRGGGARVTVQGVLSGREREVKTVTLSLQKKVTTPTGDVYIDFENIEASSTMASPLLSLTLKVNDSDNYSAHLGDGLDYVINFRNNSQADLTGLELNAKLEGGMFDLANLQTGGAFDSRTSTIRWDGSTLPALSLLRPGQTGEAKFSVRLKDNFTGGRGSANSLVKVSAHLETANVPSDLDTDKLVADNQLITRISSEPTFDQRLLIRDAQFNSSGPFPPKVGNKTSFTVNWSLTNPVNDITSAKVSAQTAPGIKWESQSRAVGTGIAASYDARTGTVVWDLGTLPGGAGVNFAKYETYFQLAVTPASNQVGQPVLLLKNIQFEGADAFTGEKISRTVQDITTSDVSDSDEGGAIQP